MKCQHLTEGILHKDIAYPLGNEGRQSCPDIRTQSTRFKWGSPPNPDRTGVDDRARELQPTRETYALSYIIFSDTGDGLECG